jgi:hypothetical protein
MTKPTIVLPLLMPENRIVQDRLMRRLLVVMTTADKEDAGTDDKIVLRIVNSDGLLAVNVFFPDTSQRDLERAQANLTTCPSTFHSAK